MTDNEMLLAISNMLEPIRNDMQEMKRDMQDMKKDMKEMKLEQTRTALLLENDVLPRLQNIESCYTSTYDRYKNSVEDYETMKQDIQILKNVVTEHTEKLQKIS